MPVICLASEFLTVFFNLWYEMFLGTNQHNNELVGEMKCFIYCDMKKMSLNMNRIITDMNNKITNVNKRIDCIERDIEHKLINSIDKRFNSEM